MDGFPFQLPLNDLQIGYCVDCAANDRDHTPALYIDPATQHGPHAHGGGAFGNGSMGVEKMEHTGLDFFLAHQQMVVVIFLHHRQGVLVLKADPT